VAWDRCRQVVEVAGVHRLLPQQRVALCVYKNGFTVGDGAFR
jgi:hypothetical protein